MPLSKQPTKKIGDFEGDKEHISQRFCANYPCKDNIPRQAHKPRQHSKEANHATGAQQSTIFGLLLFCRRILSQQ